MEFFRKKDREDDLVVLSRFNVSTSAHSLRLLLEANGIKASVVNEESGSALGTSVIGSINPIAVEVLVFRKDYASAKLVMEEVPAAAESLYPEWTCVCGEPVDKGFNVCWSCGEDHPEA